MEFLNYIMNPTNHLSYLNGQTDELLEELKVVAVEVLLQNPGTEKDVWEQTLVEDYSDEVVNAYGNNPFEVYSLLDDLWESLYYDPSSGKELDFADWASTFATDQSVQIYYDLVELRKRDL